MKKLLNDDIEAFMVQLGSYYQMLEMQLIQNFSQQNLSGGIYFTELFKLYKNKRHDLFIGFKNEDDILQEGVLDIINNYYLKFNEEISEDELKEVSLKMAEKIKRDDKIAMENAKKHFPQQGIGKNEHPGFLAKLQSMLNSSSSYYMSSLGRNLLSLLKVEENRRKILKLEKIKTESIINKSNREKIWTRIIAICAIFVPLISILINKCDMDKFVEVKLLNDSSIKKDTVILTDTIFLKDAVNEKIKKE